MDISVIIVNWNVAPFLEKCLASIYVLTKDAAFEVFVVDNNSSDGSPAMVREKFPAVTLIANNENLGFARANNQALKEARGRYALLLNPDTELTDNALKAMASFMDAHGDIDAMAPQLVFPDGTVQPSCRHFPSPLTDLMENLYLDWLFPESPFFNRYRMGYWKHDSMKAVDVPYGACLLVRRATLDKIGVFDERFFMYYDEIDLCYRIKRGGGKIYFVPQIKVVHHSRRSSEQAPVDTARWKARSKALFFKKHYGALGVSALRFNIMLQSIMAWGPLSLSHLLFRYPSDIEYIKNEIRINKGEYGRSAIK